jgi:hypothetical protein
MGHRQLGSAKDVWYSSSSLSSSPGRPTGYTCLHPWKSEGKDVLVLHKRKIRTVKPLKYWDRVAMAGRKMCIVVSVLIALVCSVLSAHDDDTGERGVLFSRGNNKHTSFHLACLTPSRFGSLRSLYFSYTHCSIVIVLLSRPAGSSACSCVIPRRN